MIVRARAAIVRHRKALLALAATGILYCAAIEAWLPRIDGPPGSKTDLVIALSSGVLKDRRLDPTAAARLGRALSFATTYDITLVTTRIRRHDYPEITSEGDQKRIVDSAGRGTRWVQLDGYALTTRDEAERLRKVVMPTRIALVTSRLHTRRACATFERLGYCVTCISSGLDGPWWRIPYSVAYESAAWIKYKVKGWI